MLWYSGSDSTSPRDSVTAKVDDSTVVSYGIQANETGFVNMMRSLAAMSVETFASSDPTSHKRFDAVSRMQNERLSEQHNSEPGSVELIMLELGQARSAISRPRTATPPTRPSSIRCSPMSSRWASRRSRWSSSR